MCLRTIEKEKILSEDLTVWKIVKYNKKDRRYYFGIYFYPKRVKTGLNRAKITNIRLIYDNRQYTSGFHCYLSEKDTIKIREVFYNHEQRQIRKFVIPKGTKVIYGTETYEFLKESIKINVIVTPILIN